MHQQPGEPIYDALGRELTVGDYVAYCAGNVLRHGPIVKILRKVGEDHYKETFYENVSLRVKTGKRFNWSHECTNVQDLKKVVKVDDPTAQ